MFSGGLISAALSLRCTPLQAESIVCVELPSKKLEDIFTKVKA
jgi:hypothetical protein